MKRPSFQFYPADWRKDPALSSCSLAARGLWIELICIAHESERYGALSINNKPMVAAQIARIVGESPKVVIALLEELESAGVFSKDAEGVIYSRRMVEDERVRNARASGGEGGKDHGIKGAEHGKKGGRPKKGKGGLETPLITPLCDEEKPPPSSSSSSSVNHSDTSLRSVSATDGGGGASAKSTEQMTKDELWSAGKSLLEQQGMPRAQCGSFVGKLVKDHGADAVVEAVRSAVVERPADAVSFLKAACVSRTSRSAKPSIHDIPARAAFAGPVAVDGAGRPIEIPDTQNMEGVI